MFDLLKPNFNDLKSKTISSIEADFGETSYYGSIELQGEIRLICTEFVRKEVKESSFFLNLSSEEVTSWFDTNKLKISQHLGSERKFGGIRYLLKDNFVINKLSIFHQIEEGQKVNENHILIESNNREKILFRPYTAVPIIALIFDNETIDGLLNEFKEDVIFG